jgi:2-amino-4-hydroxy-6-hydroxymethyldihydropteridine diphosphokinase
MKRVFLLTGSNLGDTISILKNAEVSLGNVFGHLVQKSQIYCSEAWGYESSRLFFNQCIAIETELSPHETLKKILEIETAMGRVRAAGKEYSDRVIDIDILFFGNKIIEDDLLIVPHPRMHLRKFALVPLNEIAGSIIHPVFKKSVFDLLQNCRDESHLTVYLEQ